MLLIRACGAPRSPAAAVEVRPERSDGRLRVGVWDSHPRVPAPFGEPPRDRVPLAPVDAERGRGLSLVQEYADCWGGVALADGPLDRRAGKLLWFETGG